MMMMMITIAKHIKYLKKYIKNFIWKKYYLK